MRLRTVMLSVVVLTAWSAVGRAAPVLKPVAYRDCLVQEMRAPFPERVATQSLPPGWRPVPYGSSALATIGGHSISCSYMGKEIRETWWWTAVEPPVEYRDRDIESYAYLLVASSTSPGTIAKTARACMGAWLSSADISLEALSASPRAWHSVTESERWGTDESYVEVQERADVPANRWRLFFSLATQPGYVQGARMHSFDAAFDAEESLAGRAIFGQNVNDPSIDPSSGVAMPGYFTGDAAVLEDTRMTITGSGPLAC